MNAKDDQWKGIGNCNMCRRRAYCRKQCSANKKLMAEVVRKLRIQERLANSVDEITKAEGESDE